MVQNSCVLPEDGPIRPVTYRVIYRSLCFILLNCNQMFYIYSFIVLICSACVRLCLCVFNNVNTKTNNLIAYYTVSPCILID